MSGIELVLVCALLPILGPVFNWFYVRIFKLLFVLPPALARRLVEVKMRDGKLKRVLLVHIWHNDASRLQHAR